MLFLSNQINLVDTDLHIYNYICRNLDKVIYMRIRELAFATNVSTSTILRFCKKFDCSGYAEFKFRLKQYYHEQQALNNCIIVCNELPNIAFLKSTTEPDIQFELDKAAKLLADTEVILFLGLETASRIIADYGVFLFSSLVTLSIHINEPLNSTLSSFSLHPHNNITVIILSITGEDDNLTDFISQFKSNNIDVISITNEDSSTLAKLADINLSYYINSEIYCNLNITSQIPAIGILEILARKCHTLKVAANDNIIK